MKSTGIVRKVDELGRIVLPIETVSYTHLPAHAGGARPHRHQCRPPYGPPERRGGAGRPVYGMTMKLLHQNTPQEWAEVTFGLKKAKP